MWRIQRKTKNSVKVSSYTPMLIPRFFGLSIISQATSFSLLFTVTGRAVLASRVKAKKATVKPVGPLPLLGQSYHTSGGIQLMKGVIVFQSVLKAWLVTDHQVTSVQLATSLVALARMKTRLIALIAIHLITHIFSVGHLSVFQTAQEDFLTLVPSRARDVIGPAQIVRAMPRSVLLASLKTNSLSNCSA